MSLNLVQHRGGSSVWERGRGHGHRDRERWLTAILAGGLVTAGLRRRSTMGLMLAAGAAALGWWAASGADERQRRQARLRAVWPPDRAKENQAKDDQVGEASEESFPASDAPAWTPTTGYRTSPARSKPGL